MKKYSVFIFSLILSVLLVSSVYSAAKITANTDLALGKTAYGTFSNPSVVVDPKNKNLFSDSGDVTDTPQYLTVDLGLSLYLDRVKITWDKNAYSNAYTVRVSDDSKTWIEEASDLDASMGVVDDAKGTIAQSISLQRTLLSSRYVQIVIPAGTKVSNNKGNIVRIAKVEAYPALNQKFTLENSKVYAVTENSAIISYKTSIGAAGGTAVYGLSPDKMNKSASNSDSGVNNSIVFSNLKPLTTYFYQIKTQDYYGTTASSKVSSFTTAGNNVALNKKVTGTFVITPNDKYVKTGSPENILSRVTDGNMSYFTSMATSGPVLDADQFVIVDLGKPYRLKNIVSFWRSLAYPESLSVQISSDNKNWTVVDDGIDIGNGAFTRSEAGDPVMATNTSVPSSISSARYIKMFIKKGSSFFHKHSDWNYIQLMEVKAYAE